MSEDTLPPQLPSLLPTCGAGPASAAVNTVLPAHLAAARV